MFSGIRSMFFGYTETSDESSGSTSTSNTNVSQSNEKSVINDQATASVLLEQTLNAATTKFTEQLLPQQASIEQLQSSSHQLLPTLNEQLEEDKLRTELQQSSVANGDDDDDDCFNADSWEMLDLNEKTSTNVSERVDVIDEAREAQADTETVDSTIHESGETSSDSTSKSSSGILKLNDSSNSVGNVKNQAQQQQKQHPKPKVSFETPDLVKNKKKKIVIKNIRRKPKQCLATSQQTQGKPEGGNNKTIVVADAAVNHVEPQTSGPSGTADDESSKGSLSSWPSMPQQQSSAAASVTVKQPAPALNYSAALSFKPKSAVCRNFVTPAYVTSSTEKVKSSGAVKRNRPVSSSSWSSNDQFENDATDVWDDIKETIEDRRPTGDDDDNESIMSSGFSDCDYGYEGLNDFIMKPKRSAISKRGRNGVSNASLRSMARGSSKCSPSSSSGAQSCSSKSTQMAEVSVSQQTLLSQPTKSASKGGTKPNQKKKKKLTCSTTSKPSDFLKQQQQPPKVTKNDQTELMPCPSTRAAGSSNDSSDIADMDESWYVTPPPCFTGANKLANETKVKQPKTKGDELDARENELIEHPSIYIASTKSKAPKVTYTSRRPQANEVKVDLEPEVTAAPIVVPRKATKATSTNDDAWNSDDDQDSDFDCLPSTTRAKNSKNNVARTSAKPMASGKAEFKLVTKKSSPVEAQRDAASSKPMKKEAWKNKFIVDDWNLDDQEDPASDFDDIYDTSGRKKKTQAKQSKKRQQGQKGKAAAAAPVEPKAAVVDSDSDASIEAIGSSCRGTDSSVEVIFNEDGCEPVGASLIAGHDENGQQGAEMQQENQVPGNVSSDNTDNGSTRPAGCVKAPVPVKPIEPERKPGWQLKRQRSRRRPLAATTNTNASDGGNRKQRVNRAASGGKRQQMSSSLSSGGEHSSSASSSARSTPTLIDRIGSSIVANLTNLTGGFASSPVVMAAARNQSTNSLNDPQQQHQQQYRQDQQHAVGAGGVGPNAMMAKLAVAAASNEQHQLQARKRLSKSSLRRQNVCAMQTNSQRRPDRRLRMFATQNGVSVNRKVHTNFH